MDQTHNLNFNQPITSDNQTQAFQHDTKAHNKNNGLKIALICTSVLAIAGIACGIFGFVQNNQKDAEIKNLKASANQTSSTTSTNTASETTTSNDSASSETTTKVNDTPIDFLDTLSFDTAKIVNKKASTETVTFRYGISHTNEVKHQLNFNFSSPSNKIDLIIYWPDITNDHSRSNESKTITFSQPVIEPKLSAIGTDKSILLFIMQDGSVSYMHVQDIIAGDFTIHENLGNIKNAVKIYDGTRSGQGQTGGSSENNVFVQTINGDIYSVLDILS